MKILVLVLLAGCSAPAEPCDWSTTNGWVATDVENGCNLLSLDTDVLGCTAYITPMTSGEGCTKSAEYACSFGLRATLWYRLRPPGGYMTIDGPGGCVTTATLVAR